MRKPCWLAVLSLGFLSGAACAKELAYAQHWRNELRLGPGAYFPAQGLLEKGAEVSIVKRQAGWSKVEVPGFVAGDLWAADSCLGPTPPANGLLDRLRSKTNARRYVPATAAVRGFAVRYGRVKPASVDALLKTAGPPFSAADYAVFKQNGGLYPAPMANVPGAPALGDYDAADSENGVGLGIAAAVAARGLDEDPRATRYLNMLAAQLAEGSGAYATPFRVLISSGAETNAVSIPGGWIFVTRPLLRACQNEAELAAVLAHEMTHIIARHGLKEIKARAVSTKAEEAEAELDAMGGPQDKAADGLDDLADSAYEAVHKPRLEAYEEEADRGAMLLLARAGYDPASVPRMIDRLGAVVVAGQTFETENPFAKMDYAKRRAAAEAFLKASLPGVSGAVNAERFRRWLGAPAQDAK